MRAARLHEYTEDTSRAFDVEEVPYPELERPTEIVVRVEAAGWCQTDNHVVEGLFDPVFDIELPQTLGHENAGVVEEVGEDVTTVAPGDRVVLHPVMTCGKCRACRLGEEMYCVDQSFCGVTADGGFAEYLLTSERSAVKLDSLDPVEAAPYADAGLAAYRAAKRVSRELVPGDAAMLVGIGGLGHIGLQIMDALSPATLVAVNVKEAALDLATECGATHTIDTSREDVGDAVAESVGNVDAIVDFVGSTETLGYSAQVLGQGGTHHIVGYEGTLEIPAMALVGLELNFCSMLVGTHPELQELVALAEGGAITVRTSEHELEEINEVAHGLERGEIEGRAIIRP